jgi:hypothetical protein
MVNLLKQINDPMAVLFFLRFNIAHQQEMQCHNILKLEQHRTAMCAHLTEWFKILAAVNLSAVPSCDPAVIVGQSLSQRDFALSLSPHQSSPINRSTSPGAAQ